MAEYIDRNLVLSAMNVVVEHANAIAGDSEILQKVCSILEDCKDIVAVVSAADVAPVVHGRWIVTEEYNDVIEMDVVKYACSACGEYRLSATTLSQATNYCPNCGARMDGGVSDG